MVQMLSTCKSKVDKEANKEGEEGKRGETPGEWNSPVRRKGEGEAVRYENFYRH